MKRSTEHSHYYIMTDHRADPPGSFQKPWLCLAGPEGGERRRSRALCVAEHESCLLNGTAVNSFSALHHIPPQLKWNSSSSGERDTDGSNRNPLFLYLSLFLSRSLFASVCLSPKIYGSASQMFQTWQKITLWISRNWSSREITFSHVTQFRPKRRSEVPSFIW